MSEESLAADPAKAGRKADGTFTPGNRVNPKGRPQGSRNSATILAEKLMQDGIDNIVKTVMDAAGETLIIATVRPDVVEHRRGGAALQFISVA